MRRRTRESAALLIRHASLPGNATPAPSSAPIISQSLSINGSRTVTYNVTVTPTSTPSTLPIASTYTTGGIAGTAVAPAPGVGGTAAGPNDNYIHNAAAMLAPKTLLSIVGSAGAVVVGSLLIL